MINEIRTNFLRVDMTIKDTSRGLLVSSNSPKKQTNEFIFTNMTNSFSGKIRRHQKVHSKLSDLFKHKDKNAPSGYISLPLSNVRDINNTICTMKML